MPRENQGPYLKRNAARRYEIRWTEDGRSRRRSTGTSDLLSAQKVLGAFLQLDDRDRRQRRDDDTVMVLDVLGDEDAPGKDYWTEHVQPNVVDKDSVRYAYAKLKKHFGHLAVADINPEDVAAYIDDRKAGRLGRPSVGHTIARELSVLIAAINHAAGQKRLPKTDIPVISLPSKSPPRDRWLTEDEADALLAAAAERNGKKLSRIYRFVTLALWTASRKAAILELRRSQVDLANGMIYLNPEGRVQTNKRRPQVPICDELRPILARTLREIPINPDAFLLDHDGSIRTAFENAVERAKLPGKVTPHTLRHTWATWAAQGGTSMFEIAGVLGDSVATVTRTYAHHAPDYLRSAVNSVRPSTRKESSAIGAQRRA